MRRNSKGSAAGFTLFELLIVLAIIGIMWGLGVSSMPRLLSGYGSEDVARQMAGAGHEARQMAMLQGRPWELLFDLDQRVYYRSPKDAVKNKELRNYEGFGAGALDLAQRAGGGSSGALTSLRTVREYDSKAYDFENDESNIFNAELPEDIAIVQIWKNGGIVENAGRVNLLFSPRGYCLPTVLWLKDISGANSRFTLYFLGMLPPLVTDGFRLPDPDGFLGPDLGDVNKNEQFN